MKLSVLYFKRLPVNLVVNISLNDDHVFLSMKIVFILANSPDHYEMLPVCLLGPIHMYIKTEPKPN